MIALRLAALDAGAAELDAWHATLDPGERARAAAFRRPCDRDRFVARRGLARAWLGELLGVAPDAVALTSDAYGKPRVLNDARLQFSSAHSAGRWLAAAAWGQPVGCDLEHHRADLADPAVAERLFAPEERTALGRLSGDAYVSGFFTCWARKEAFVKALGQGLSYPLDAFAVSLDEPARLLRGGAGWALRTVAAGDGWSAALAVPADTAVGPVERIR